MRRAKPATGFGFSGKIALALVVVVTSTGAFLLGYFVGKSVSASPVQALPVNPSAVDQPVLTDERKAAETPLPVGQRQPEKIAERAAPPAAVQEQARTALEPEKGEKAKSSTSQEGSKISAREAITYTVQVGAFRSLDEANALKDRLGEKGFDAAVKKASEHGKMMYKVTVGQTAERKEAEVLALRLKKSEGLKAFVTKKN